MLNSTQAYQLSAAMTPTFMSSLPPTSPQSMALGMQEQQAQGGIQAELYKKAMKKKSSSGIGGLIGGAAAIAAAPFTGGASLSFLPAAMSAGNAVEGIANGDTAQGATQLMGAAGSAYGTYSNAAADSATTPVVSAAPAVSNAVQEAGGMGTPGSTPLRRSGGAPVNTDMGGGESNTNVQADLMAKGLGPTEAAAIGRIQDMTPQQFRSMGENERMALLPLALDNGVSLSHDQARALPTKERRSLQKQYGPDLVPMTTMDHLAHRIDSYNTNYAPGRIAQVYPGLEELY